MQAVSSAPVGGSIESAQARHRKLVDASQQFEAMLIQQLLKPADGDASAFSLGDADNTGGDSSTLEQYGLEAMSRAVAAAGGFGIGHRLVQQVDAQNAHAAESVTA